MSIQYPVLGFEPTVSWTWVSSRLFKLDQDEFEPTIHERKKCFLSKWDIKQCKRSRNREGFTDFFSKRGRAWVKDTTQLKETDWTSLVMKRLFALSFSIFCQQSLAFFSLFCWMKNAALDISKLMSIWLNQNGIKDFLRFEIKFFCWKIAVRCLLCFIN